MRRAGRLVALSASVLSGLVIAGGGSAFGVTATIPAPLSGVQSMASQEGTNCALVTAGRVDCWGAAQDGQLGNGSGPWLGRARPVQVHGVGGAGLLNGVASLATGQGSTCAVLRSGRVDCWGGHRGDKYPVPVPGVGSSGTLSGVSSVTSDGNGYCALLTSGAVDCWGYDENGQLGFGAFATNAGTEQVLGVGGTGTLSGVVSLASDGDGYCAVVGTTRVVDCWGDNQFGQLGSGAFRTSGHDGSAYPVHVRYPNGQGSLSQVATLTGFGNGYCALLTSGAVDCWGYGATGQLGNGRLYGSQQNYGSDLPVRVKGATGSGTLGGVASLTTGFGSGPEGHSSFSGGTICALHTSGVVDCWGAGNYGQVGAGLSYNWGTPVPEQVVSTFDSGELSGVASLTTNSDGTTFCARLTSGGVDCWGYGQYGELGDGSFYPTSPHYGSSHPVAVDAVGGTGTLSGVAALYSGGHVSIGTAIPSGSTTCAVLTSGSIDCWGFGRVGQLGDGVHYITPNYGSAVPVQVQ